MFLYAADISISLRVTPSLYCLIITALVSPARFLFCLGALGGIYYFQWKKSRTVWSSTHKKARHKNTHCVIPFYKILAKLAELIHAVRSQDSGYPWGGGAGFGEFYFLFWVLVTQCVQFVDNSSNYTYMYIFHVYVIKS